jgi:hypothetical protein
VLRPADSDVTPLEADVDSDVTWLFVVLTPVDSDMMPLEADVDSDVTWLFVVLRPVDNETIPLDADVDSDVTSLFVVLSPLDSVLRHVLMLALSVLYPPGLYATHCACALLGASRVTVPIAPLHRKPEETRRMYSRPPRPVRSRR